MSETVKTADAAKKATDQTAKSAQAAIDAAEKSSKEAMSEAVQMAQHATERSKQVGQSINDTVAQTASAATNLSSRAAEQGREVLMMGMRTAAGVGGRVGDINFGRSRHLMSSAAHAMDVYREATERSAERVQALFSSAVTFGRGMQQMQHAWLEMMDHNMEHAVHKPQDLLRCKNIVEVAEVQRDLYLDAVNHAFESTNRLLDLASRAAQDAVRTLQTTHAH